MAGYETHGGGWADRFRRIGESLLALARNRFELVAVEWQEEKLRLFHLLLWLGVALGLGFAALLVAMGALSLWAWQLAGYLGLVVLALAALAGAAGIAWGIRRRIQYGPKPFAETIAEFRRDSECLQRDS